MKTALRALILLSMALPLHSGWVVTPSARIAYSSEPGKGHATFEEALKELSVRGQIHKLTTIYGFELLGEESFQKELFAGLERDAPRELREARNSAGNMHNPKMSQLRKPFAQALLATPTITTISTSLAAHDLAITGSSIEKFELRNTQTDPRGCFSGILYLSITKSGGASDPRGARRVFDDPIRLFPNSFLPVLSRFEKAKIETTLRGFYLQADTFSGFNQEHDPSAAGIYLNVAVRDPQEIPEFKDTSKVAGEITERTVEFPEAEMGGVALRVVFKFGSHANPETIKAIRKDIEEIINRAPTHKPR